MTSHMRPHLSTPRPTSPSRKRSESRLRDYSITAVRWNREFCRLEAEVTLQYVLPGSSVPRVRKIRTSVAIMANAPRGFLRSRLLRNALDLATLMSFSPKNISSAA